MAVIHIVPLAAFILAATGVVADWGPISSVGATGLLGWYIFYDTAIARPRQAKLHREEREDQEARHRVERAEDRELFAQVVRGFSEK